MASNHPPLDIELMTSAECFHTLEPEWNGLLREAPSRGVFLSWEWASAWWEVFREKLTPWVLVAREPSRGRVVGIAPFVLRRLPLRRGFCRELSLLGNTAGAADHLDLIARCGYQQAVAAEVAAFLRRHRIGWDLVRLDGMSADSPLLGELRPYEARTTAVWDSVCPYLPLPARLDDFLAGLAPKVFKNHRSSVRRLARDTCEPVSFHRVRSPMELPEAMGDLFHLHQSRRLAKGDRGAFHEEPVRRFHLRLAERFLSRDWLRLYQLRVGARVIATAYCFDYEGTVSFYQTGYAGEWARYSPGSAVIAHAICSSIEDGAHEFDFLRGAEQYKFRWTQFARRNVLLRMPTTARGRLLLLARRVSPLPRGVLREAESWLSAQRSSRRSSAEFALLDS